MIDPYDPTNHGKPLWVVFGEECFPEIICCKLMAYSESHALLPIGTKSPHVCIWGYSTYRGESGFRTLGANLKMWSSRSGLGPLFFDTQAEALDKLRELTTPRCV